jgi:L-lactate dehydrogenase complex protein LldG
MDTVATFEASLDGQSTVHRTDAASVADAFEAAVEPPAVGTPLPFEGVSLADAGIETDPDLAAIDAARTGVTRAELGVADYGTVTIPSSGAAEELCSLYVPRHVAVVAASDVVPDMPAAFERIDGAVADGDATRILATGPSSTADMGGLIRGVHGPHETHVVVLEDR